MNTTPRAAAPTTATSTRAAGLGLAAVMTLAMLLGVNGLASVDAGTAAQLATAQPAASAAQT